MGHDGNTTLAGAPRPPPDDVADGVPVHVETGIAHQTGQRFGASRLVERGRRDLVQPDHLVDHPIMVAQQVIERL